MASRLTVNQKFAVQVRVGEQGVKMATLKEEAEKFDRALKEFLMLCAKEIGLVRLLDFMEKKLKHKQNTGP